jgi:hypothetical protein
MQDEQNGQQITIANISLPIYIQGYTNPFHNSEKKLGVNVLVCLALREVFVNSY